MKCHVCKDGNLEYIQIDEIQCYTCDSCFGVWTANQVFDAKEIEFWKSKKE